MEETSKVTMRLGGGKADGVIDHAAGRLSVSNFNLRIPTTDGTAAHMEEHHKDTWRYHVIKFIHQAKVQQLLMFLLFMDVIILFVEFYLLAEYPHCSTITRDALSCCPIFTENTTTTNETGDGLERFLSEAASSESASTTTTEHLDNHNQHADYCEVGDVLFDYAAGCDEHKYGTVHITEKVLFGLTMTILCLFFIELNVSMIAMKPAVFFRQFFFLLDYTIVTVSLALEITFFVLKSEIYRNAINILIVLRLWRFVRIGHGFIELTHNLAQVEYNELVSYAEELELLLKQNNITNIPEHHKPKSFHSIHHDHSNHLSDPNEVKDRFNTNATKNDQLEVIKEEQREEIPQN